MKQPIKVFGDLTTFGLSDAIFSPDEQFIVTGTSLSKDESSAAHLIFYDKQTLEKAKQIGTTYPHEAIVQHEHIAHFLMLRYYFALLGRCCGWGCK